MYDTSTMGADGHDHEHAHTPLEALAWRRRVGIAVTLSGLVPGAGQLFAGRPVRAAIALVSVAGGAVVATVAVACWRLTPLTLLLPMVLTLAVHLTVIADAVRQVRRARVVDRRWRSAWLHGAVILVVTALSGVVVEAVGQRIVGWERIDDATMAATLLPGDVVAVSRVRCGRPGVGEVVVVRDSAGGERIRRCVAQGGSTIEVRSGIVYVDGLPLEPPVYAHGAWGRTHIAHDHPPRAVPDGWSAVLGDNRGPPMAGGWQLDVVENHRVVGTVGFILWSFSAEDGPRWFRLGLPLEHSLMPTRSEEWE